MLDATRYYPNKSSNISTMTCLEYERLSIEDFADEQDFEYLLGLTLPCFEFLMQAGKLQLLVKHYLAKIALPSGRCIEILPKISDLNSCPNAHALTNEVSVSAAYQPQSQIQAIRQWVKQMLIDIAAYDLQHILPVIDLVGALNEGNEGADRSVVEHSGDSHPNTSTPWYDWILKTAERKLNAAQQILPRRYQVHTYNYPQAKGKINLKAQLKANLHRPHYLHTEQAVLADDVLIAQFLATSWQVLRRLSLDTQPVRNVLWNGIATLPKHQWRTVYEHIDRDKPTWQSQLTQKHALVLNQALSWAWWLLNHQTQTNCHTSSSSIGLPVPTLMINMNHAFEIWVLSRLQQWVATNLTDSKLVIHPSLDWLSVLPSRMTSSPLAGLSQREQASHNVVEFPVIQRLVPDAYIQSSDQKISHVIDIKYKQIQQVFDVSSRDWQQLFIYQNYLQAPKAWLIYPMTLGFNTPIAVGDTSRSTSIQSNDNHETAIIPFDVNLRQIVY